MKQSASAAHNLLSAHGLPGVQCKVLYSFWVRRSKSRAIFGSSHQKAQGSVRTGCPLQRLKS